MNSEPKAVDMDLQCTGNSNNNFCPGEYWSQVTSEDFTTFEKTYSDPCLIIIIAPNRAVTTQPPSR